MNEKYPWEQIATEYITGYFVTDPETFTKKHWYPTYEDLHKKYGMNLDYLRKKGQKERWSSRREALQAKLKEKTAQNTLHSYISDSAHFDAMTIIAMKKMYRLIEAFFDQYDILESNPDGTVSIRDLSEEDRESLPAIKVHELKSLVETLDKAQILVRRTVGEPLHGDAEAYKSLAEEIFIGNSNDPEEALQREKRISKLIEKREQNAKNIEVIKKQLEEIKSNS
jgi:hypothetical protein